MPPDTVSVAVVGWHRETRAEVSHIPRLLNDFHARPLSARKVVVIYSGVTATTDILDELKPVRLSGSNGK